MTREIFEEVQTRVRRNDVGVAGPTQQSLPQHLRWLIDRAYRCAGGDTPRQQDQNCAVGRQDSCAVPDAANLARRGSEWIGMQRRCACILRFKKEWLGAQLAVLVFRSCKDGNVTAQRNLDAKRRVLSIVREMFGQALAQLPRIVTDNVVLDSPIILRTSKDQHADLVLGDLGGAAIECLRYDV